MMHHLYKEPQDHIEPIEPCVLGVNTFELINDDSKQITQLKETNHELKITLLLTLGFTAGFVFAMLSGLFARIV